MDISFFDRLFGIKCPHCKERTDMRRDEYTRGYNNMCEQASGCSGFYCMSCGGITYTLSYEEDRRVTPAWCTVEPDSEKRRWFPDFKYNRSVAHVPTHRSHELQR